MWKEGNTYRAIGNKIGRAHPNIIAEIKRCIGHPYSAEKAQEHANQKYIDGSIFRALTIAKLRSQGIKRKPHKKRKTVKK